MKEQKLINAIKQEIEIVGSQNKVATKFGVSSAQISNIIAGRFDKVSEDMRRKLSNQLNLFQGWQIAPTRNLKRIRNICIQAQKFQIAKAIAFNPGTGKTTGLKHYANHTPNTFYIEAEEYWSKKVLLWEIRKAMSIDDGAAGVYDLTQSIINKLNKIDHPLIIIDEADKLKDGVLNLFKSLYNKAKSGFVLAGTPHFIKRIDKGLRLKKMGFAEIHSRLGGHFIPLKEITQEDIITIASQNNITSEHDLKYLINSNSGDLRHLKAAIEKLQFKQQANL